MSTPENRSADLPSPCTPDEVIARIPEGATVLLAGGAGHPAELVSALDRRPDLTRGLHVVWTRPAGFDHPPPRVPGGTLTTFFGARDLAEVDGRVRVVPMQYRQIWDYLAEECTFDAALVRLTPPDDSESCGYGTGVDFFPAVVDGSEIQPWEPTRGLSPDSPETLVRPVAERAPLVLAEIDASTPRIARSGVAASRIAAWCPAHTPAAAREVSGPSAEATAIGRHVAQLVDDGDCIQTGIGAIPDAVLRELHDRRDLGCHSGMISDGVLSLVEAGALTGARKTIDRGRIVSGFVLGSVRLYAWAERAPELDLRPVSYTHDARILAQIDNLVAINSAIEVDLLGQVNAETIAGRLVSGTGGSVDFCRGAALSRGGRSIVALPATAAGGTISRIVPALAAGHPATTLRTDVHYVVTEHGTARLHGADATERAERLLAIAAPEHRRALAETMAH